MPSSPTLAREVATAEWTRATPASAAYSVEVPCNADEVALHSALNVQSAGEVLVSERRERAAGTVTCIKGGTTFTAQVITLPDGEPLPVPVYDLVIETVRPELPASLQVTETTLSGHRAFMTQEVEGATTARSGVIELTDRSYLLMIGGGLADRGEVPADFPAHLDRFFASVEIAKQ